jgi:glycosyltransferase involved in cell wall biosynthesis
MNVVQVGFGYDDDLVDPDQLLDRYATLTGWSEALIAAGAARVTVVHRFRRRAHVVRRGVEYRFCPRDLRTAVVEFEPGVVHVNGLNAPGRTWWLKRCLTGSTPLLVQHHGGGPQRPVSALGRLRRAVRRHAMAAADGFIFTAASQADVWRCAGLIRSTQHIHEVVESSTSLAPLDSAAARLESGISGSPAVLWVGRLNANKDPITVIDAFARLAAAHPEASLTMVYGEDAGLHEVRDRIEAAPSMKSRIHLVGPVPHERLAAYYSAADLFVLGSHDEGSGYAVIEACACGAIPVVTDIPSFRAITGRGTIGQLWTPGHTEGCFNALAAATRRIDIRERMRTIDHFRQQLSWSAIGRSAMRAYEEARRLKRDALGPRRSA